MRRIMSLRDLVDVRRQLSAAVALAPEKERNEDAEESYGTDDRRCYCCGAVEGGGPCVFCVCDEGRGWDRRGALLVVSSG
jgi:hypothetical protein